MFLEQQDSLLPQVLKVVRRARLENADREAMRAWLNQGPPDTPPRHGRIVRLAM